VCFGAAATCSGEDPRAGAGTLASRHWLFKEEPSHYAFHDLERDRETEWDGVRNPLAVRNLRSMAAGEEGFFYHSGTVRAIVGRVEVARAARWMGTGEASGWSVRLRAVAPLPRPIPLSEIKADPPRGRFDLLRIPRLSVVEVPGPIWADLLDRAATSQTARASARGNRRSASRRNRSGA
jgi:predicted RNA-binding protein with PUA-like domain